jgi:hypothetical protein
MDPGLKARYVKALLRLSRASGLYPECLALKGIEMEAEPVDRGGYGESESFQCRLETRLDEHRERQFYTHTLQRLTTTSGQHVEFEECMVASLEVVFGHKIGSGGLYVCFRSYGHGASTAVRCKCAAISALSHLMCLAFNMTTQNAGYVDSRYSTVCSAGRDVIVVNCE